MYYEQLAFANRQLAGLLKSGIPLEEGLEKFAGEVKDRKLAAQFKALEQQLAQGVALPKALENSTFPPFYKKLVSIGCQSNDLPEVLLMVADHYEKTAALRLQLQGMMVYPAIVIAVSLAVTLGTHYLFAWTIQNFHIASSFEGMEQPRFRMVWVFEFFPWLFVLMTVVLSVIVLIPGLRGKFMRWVPGFNESVLARIGSACSILLKKGVPLAEALDLIAALESGPFRPALLRWASDVRSGSSKIEQSRSRPSFPGLFVSFLQNSAQNLVLGFSEAGLFYERRAKYKTEIVVYCLLPVVTIALSFLVFVQAAGAFQLVSSYLILILGI